MPANAPIASLKVKKYLKNLGADEVSKEYDYLKAIQLKSVETLPPERTNYERVVYRNPYIKPNDNVY
jgi:hypothetical protein